MLKTVKKPGASDVDSNGDPKAAFGVDGEFAVTYYTNTGATKSTIDFYEKISGAWYKIVSASTIALDPVPR